MYKHNKVNLMTENANKVIIFLSDLLMHDQKVCTTEGIKSDINDKMHQRIICDFISGMTDNYAGFFIHIYKYK